MLLLGHTLVVDGANWQRLSLTNPEVITVRDQMGNINNCITVIDQSMYLHEHAASGFFGDTPHNMYTQALPDEITLAKEPPLAPPDRARHCCRAALERRTTPEHAAAG